MKTKFFDDLEVGESSRTAARTITEADVVNFAGLSGDFNPIHVDEVYAQGTPFKQRICHGLLVLSVASGLFTHCEMNLAIKESLIALLDVQWRFLKPVFPGDTVHVVAEVKEKKEVSKPERGIVKLERTVYNQRGEIVQQGETALMLRKKPV